MFKEPLKNAGPSTGQLIRKMDILLDEYYDFMGYDKNGIPTVEKLNDLGLGGMAPAMSKFRKQPDSNEDQS
jgi:aldehyde:ferredoxin oxidoreductase